MAQSHEDFLAASDETLLRQCEIHFCRSTGPGGQHRNKVSSCVRLRHRPTEITAHGDESRSQAENKVMAVRRLRMNIACQLRRPVNLAGEIPPHVRECIFVPRGKNSTGGKRIQIGRKDFRFWHVAAFLLDLLDTLQGRLAESADFLGVTTSNFSSLLQEERHLLGAAQLIRKSHGQRPLA